ncbi:Uncharacterised protein [Mycobacteroides abscessus subsp. abscessus]|nr:Uncharacterised protein [Mycobacteroides abscessus subsp. abscessus]
MEPITIQKFGKKLTNFYLNDLKIGKKVPSLLFLKAVETT